MPLTQDQINQWLTKNYGGGYDSSGAYQPGAYTFNPNDNLTNWQIAGAAQANGISPGQVASTLNGFGGNLSAGDVSGFEQQYAPQINGYQQGFQNGTAGAYGDGSLTSASPGGISSADINGWLASHPGATDQQIRAAMDQYGVSPQQMAAATGMSLGDIQNRYAAAGNTAGSGGVVNGMGGATNTPPGAPGMPTLNTGYTPNPYLASYLGNMGTQLSQQFGEQILPQIRASAMGAGTFGGGKQGVAEGIAARGLEQSLAQNGTSLLYNDYTGAQQRNLQQYQGDQNFYLGNQGQQMGFYTNQRGQDIQSLLAGANLYGAGMQGPWSSLTSAGNIYGSASGQNTIGNTTSGGGTLGAIGGGIAGTALGGQLGWY